MKKVLFLLAFLSAPLYAAEMITVPVTLVEGKKPIGVIKLASRDCGVLITPDLKDLPPGTHGFHVHENPNCGDKAMAAGAHFDPTHAGKHEGPYNNGHLGDLPVLIVNQDGTATLPIFAPKFKLSELKNHSIVIHAGSDNYSDTPEKLGGGGARIACGIIGQ